LGTLKVSTCGSLLGAPSARTLHLTIESLVIAVLRQPLLSSARRFGDDMGDPGGALLPPRGAFPRTRTGVGTVSWFASGPSLGPSVAEPPAAA